jgi:hypothetical protein
MRRAFNKTALAGFASMAALVASSAQAAPSRAGDDPGFQDSGLTSIAAIDGRGFKLEGRINTLYDSNMIRAGDNTTPRPGSVRADYRISPVATASVGLPIGRQQIFIGADYGHDYYIHNTQLDHSRYTIGGGINLRAGTRCTGTIAGDFNRRLNLFSDVAEVVPNVEKRLQYGASAQCQGPVGLGFGGSIRRYESRNELPSRKQYDLDSVVFSPNISYALGNIGRFSVSGSVNKVDYIRRPVLLPDGTVAQDGVKILSGRFGYERAIGSRMALSLGLSYLESKPQPTTILQAVGIAAPPAPPGTLVFAPTNREKFSGPGYDASLSYKPSPRLTAIFSAGHNASASANVGAQYQVQTNLALDLDYKLGSSMSVGAGVTHDSSNYYNSFTSVSENQRRISDKINRVYGSIVYTPVKLYSLSLLVAYQDRKSNPVDYSYNSFSAMLSLNVNFGRQS